MEFDYGSCFVLNTLYYCSDIDLQDPEETPGFRRPLNIEENGSR